MFEPLFIAFGVMLVWMSFVWIAHVKLQNAGIVDVGWASGLVLLVWFYALSGDGALPRKVLIVSMVTLWGVRLGAHLLFDRVLGKSEDPRYKRLRESWSRNENIRMFLFFQMQGALNAILSIPFLLMCLDPFPSLRIVEWAGLGIWALALGGEAVADAQLKTFKADPANRGRVCEAGFWNYSRHPNYFFEWLVWVAYFCVASQAPFGFMALISPLLMLYFLVNVTGIPPTEAQALQTRGDAYRRYQQTTSPFVPWFKGVPR